MTRTAVTPIPDEYVLAEWVARSASEQVAMQWRMAAEVLDFAFDSDIGERGWPAAIPAAWPRSAKLAGFASVSWPPRPQSEPVMRGYLFRAYICHPGRRREKDVPLWRAVG